MRPVACNITILAGVILAIGAGCRAGGGAAKPPPGRSAVAVVVRAEPKAGWKDPAQHGTAYDPVEIGGSRAYKTVNYSNLEEIVVWLETPTGKAMTPQQVTIDVGRPSGALHAGGLQDGWTIVNSAPESLSAYARYESGRIVDLGTIAPGGEVSHRPQEAGAVDIVCEPKPDAVARVFVAPIATSAAGTARVVTSGERVVFNDLPPGGTARVACWHPRLPGSVTDVMLVPGVTSNATLVVGVNQLPKVR